MLPGVQRFQSHPVIHFVWLLIVFLVVSSGTVKSPSQLEGKIFPNGNALSLVFRDGRTDVSSQQNSLNSLDPAGPHLSVAVQPLRRV